MNSKDYLADAPATPAYCVRCDYPLSLTAEAHFCPQCMLAFDPDRAETYSDKPHLSRWKFWLPGFLAAVASGVISYALLLQTGDMGPALFIAVPISFGAILGYGTRIQTWLLGGATLLLIVTVVSALITANLAGIFCGFTLGIIFLIPAGFGVAIGVTVRIAMAASHWNHRWYFHWFTWAAVLLPYGAEGIELLIPNREEIGVVRTDLHIDATPAEAWKAVMFYEDVKHDPPWLLHLALPKPIRSEGEMREGETVRCFYDSGYLSKRISRVVPGERIDFDVVEQKTGAERNITLLGGSFEVQPSSSGQSHVVLTTRYRHKLRPTWIWEPFEHKVIHTLHGHVLNGMRMKAEGREPTPAEPYRPTKPAPPQPPLALQSAGKELR